MRFNVLYAWIMTVLAAANCLAFSKNELKLRALAFLSLLIFTWRFYHSSHEFTHMALVNGSVTAMIWIHCLKIFDDICLTQVSFGGSPRYPTLPAGSNIPGADQDREVGFADGNVHWALEYVFNFRGIGTIWTVTHITPIREDDGTPPSRRTYLLWAAGHVFACYFMLELLDRIMMPLPSAALALISVDKEEFFSRLSGVTGEDLYVRFAFLIVFWLAFGWIIRGVYFGFAFIHAGLGVHSVEYWPEVFSEWTKTYSLRIFWGVTFHQEMRRPFDSISGFISHKILRLPQRSLLARYSKVLYSFSIAAFVGMQAVAAMNGSQYYEYPSVAKFFLLQPVGFIIEDFVQEMWGRIFGRETALWRSYFGMAWTIAFLFYSSPYLIYPVARILTEKESVLVPVTIIDHWHEFMDYLFANATIEVQG